MCYLIYQHIYFQDHGFILIYFALSYFVCHNSCLFFSVLVVWTVHASFREHFQEVTTVFFYVSRGYKLWSLRLSLCYKKIQEIQLFLHHLQLCIVTWPFCCGTMRVSGFLHSFTVQLKSPARCAWEAVLHKLWSALKKPVTRIHSCPAARPDIAGHRPNLARASKKNKDSTDTLTERLFVLTLCSECVSQGRCSLWQLS